MSVTPSIPAVDLKVGELVAVTGAEWVGELIALATDTATGRQMAQVQFPFTLRAGWFNATPMRVCVATTHDRWRYPVTRPCLLCRATPRQGLTRLDRYCLVCHDPDNDAVSHLYRQQPNDREPLWREGAAR